MMSGFNLQSRSNLDILIARQGTLVLADEQNKVNFKRWAESKDLTFYEIYKFRYKEDYRIYRIKKNKS